MKKTTCLRKLISVLLAALLLSTFVTAAAVPATATATPTTSTVYVNGSPVAFQAYTIDGNNYFKLRDVAAALNSSAKHFDVYWDGSAIQIISSGYYIMQGGELTVSGAQTSVTANKNASAVYLNGKQLSLAAYTIGGNNYFKLRDIGAALDFGVKYNASADTITIDPTQHYFISSLLELLQDSYNHAQYDSTTGVLFYNGTSSGYIKITMKGLSDYYIDAEGNSGDSDTAILKNIVGIFVNTPDDVMSALTASKSEGTKTFKIGDKTITCLSLATSQTLHISW